MGDTVRHPLRVVILRPSIREKQVFWSHTLAQMQMR